MDNPEIRKLIHEITNIVNPSIMEVPLCEVDHIYLKPNRLYRFIVIPGCKDCESLAKESEVPEINN